ncbi:vacuolar protein sorting-associated protein 52 [Microdochium nivale]|nr:vacuolar protein sorting-associated protein 52 [Microdochium nivale]
MWPNRIAGQSPSPSPSQPGSRAFSPTPRRTPSSNGPYMTSQQRPGVPPRSVSLLSLASNDSSNSSVPNSRRANGSALKQSTTVYTGSDPIAVLKTILGNGATAIDDADKPLHTISAEDLELAFDFSGMSLRKLALSEAPEQTASTSQYPRQSISDYEQDKTRFDDLHRSIRACDDVLGSVEVNLTSFRNDLAAVSADIETLQARSAALNVRLENRRAVEKGLGPVVDDISVSPVVVSKIVDGPIDEAWIKVLSEVDRRAAAHEKAGSATERSKGFQDLGPLLEKLVLKAIERIRDYLVSQVKALRSPNINAQVLQQQNFLRFKDLFTFLHKHHANLAEEVCQAYLNTMRWYYQNQFSRYEGALRKIKLHILDKTDVLGNEDPSRKGAIRATSKTAGPPHDAFNLGRRIDVMRTKNQHALSSHIAEEDQATHYLEVPFRNFNLALVDNTTAEYTFMNAFFSPALNHSAISRHFAYIFEPTFQLGHAMTRALISETFDALGLLLAVRLNQQFQFELQRRKVPTVDGHVNGTAMLLWPRLQYVMGAHCDSLRQLTSALPSTRSKADQAKMSAAPHVATQRFGQLAQGILQLSTEAGGDDEPIVTSLRRLRSEIEAFLTKYSSGFGAGADNKRKRERFLYNNYSLILTIISDIGGKLALEEQSHFESLKAAFQEAG